MKQTLRSILITLTLLSPAHLPAAELGRSGGDGGWGGSSERSANRQLNNRAAQCALNKAKQYLRRNAGARRLRTDFVTLIDYDAPRNTQRMMIVNLRTGQVTRHTVAAGKGGINTKAGSRGSELGFMKFSETYIGKHGLSVRIDGLENGNKDARSRAIVLHGASYVRENGAAGRSWGCPAVDKKSLKKIIPKVKNGGLLYAYQSSKLRC